MKIDEDMKLKIKELIARLQEGEKPEKVKEEFKDVLEKTTPEVISRIEQELIKEGMGRDELRKLCDVHLAVFKESIEKQELEVAPGHPIHTFKEEHKFLSKAIDELDDVWKKIRLQGSLKIDSEEFKGLKHIAEHLMEAEKHNVREENVLFPYIEKKGVTEPPRIMWSEHNEIKERKKKFLEMVNGYKEDGYSEFVQGLDEIVNYLVDNLRSHIYKENNILYPTAMRLIDDDEWKEIKKECDELGYCCFTPADVARKEKGEAKKEAEMEEGRIVFETGAFSKDELEAMLDTLPVDVSFVGEDDTVRYFNRSDVRIFPRTKAVLGRTVQQCHPEKSLDLVNKILDDFRSGKENVAEFWIQMNGRFIHIRYFAIRDKENRYLGTLEVSQDVTDIKKLEGEKRLL